MFDNFIPGTDNQGKLAFLPPLPSLNSLAVAACLLFSSEKLVKIYLGHLARLGEDSGDLRRLAGVLVALIVTCRRLNNSLEQGMAKILRWVLNLPRRETTITNLQLIEAIMTEFNRRLQLREVDPNTVCELGVFITNELLKKKDWDQGVSTEIGS